MPDPRSFISIYSEEFARVTDLESIPPLVNGSNTGDITRDSGSHIGNGYYVSTRRDQTPEAYDPYAPIDPGYHVVRAIGWDDPEGRATLLASFPEVSHAGLIVDLGAGTGALAASLRKVVPGVIVCIEKRPEMTTLGKRFNPGTPWMLGDALLLPLRDNVAHVVMTAMMLHQVDRKEQLLREIRRVLRSEGTWILIHTVPEDLAHFALYQACPELLTEETKRFSSGAEIERIGRAEGFVPRAASIRVLPRHSISLRDLHDAIRNRCVSVLASLPDHALYAVINRVSGFIRERRLSEVPGYPYHIWRWGLE